MLQQVVKKPTMTRRVREGEGINMVRSSGPDIGQITVAGEGGDGALPDS